MKFTTRNILAYFLSLGYLSAGIVKKNRIKLLSNSCIISLCFHNPSKDFFKACINWLKRKGFSFISINELLAISKGELDFPLGAVLVTFDDGWRNNKENVASVANELGIPITIFATTDPIEKREAYWWSYIKTAYHIKITKNLVSDLKKVNNFERMDIVNNIKERVLLPPEALSTENLKDLNKSPYITFGSHTVTHPILPKCSDKESFFEIAESKKRLQSILDNTIDSFAYPNGDFSNREVSYLNDTGYKLAFTTKPALITKNNINELYTLPRFGMLEDASIYENICRMTGVWFNNKFLNKNS